MFPDLSDSCNWGTGGLQPPGYTTGAGGTGLSWNEPNVGNPPGDRRGVISMGPFTFQPGGHHEIHLAFVWARQYTDPSPLAAVELLKSRIDLVREAYEIDSVSCGGSFSGINKPGLETPDLLLFPNPATSLLNVQYVGTMGQAEYAIVNFLGETVGQGTLQNKVLKQIAVGDLSPGMYFMVVRDGANVETGRFVRR
jgi:hypothetical protein